MLVNEFQALLYNASRLLSKLTQSAVVKNGAVDDDPVDLIELSEVADAVSRAVDPIMKRIADQGGLESKNDVFSTLISDHVEDYVSSGLRGKAQKIREDAKWEGTDPGYDRADRDHKLSKEPV